MRRYALGVTSGALMAVGFAPYHAPYLLPMAVACLALALRDATPRQGFAVGAICGLVHAGATLFWLANLFGSAVVPLCVILAAFPMAFGALWPRVAARIPLPWQPLAAAALWTGLEFWRAEPFVLNFGWIGLGYATAGRPAFAPLAACVGVYGTTFGLVALSFWAMPDRRRLVAVTLVWTALCALPLPAPAPERPLSVRMVQSFLDEDALFQLSPGASKPDVLLWPEYAFHDDPRATRVGERTAELARGLGVHLIYGAEDWQGEPDDRRYRNTAFVVGPDGATLGTHTKNHPVHLVRDGIAGTEARAIPTALGRLGIAICFDCDYPDVVRRLCQDGAEALLIPNMDPSEWGKVQQAQHRALFAMRAMENGRWLARADVAGGTSVVAPNGVETARIASSEAGVLDATVGRITSRTLYTRGGWLFGPASLVAAGCLAVFALFPKRRFPRRRTEPIREVRHGR